MKAIMTTEELLSQYDTLTKTYYKERGLWNLLKANEKSIKGIIEYNYEHCNSPADVGYQFHKAFRQTDVTDIDNGGYMDMAIWELLKQAEFFWTLFPDSNND